MSFPRRIGEIFDIIIDYPDSKGALQDLKVSLDVLTLGRLSDKLSPGMFAEGRPTVAAGSGTAKGVRIELAFSKRI